MIVAGRRLGGAIASVGVGAGVLTTAGCTPSTDGRLGIGTDDQGRYVVRVAACHSVATGFTFYHHHEGANPLTTLGRAHLSVPAGQSETFALADLVGQDAVDEIAPGERYSLRGRTDGSAETDAVSFTVADLSTLEPGVFQTDLGPATADELDAGRCAANRAEARS